jgi:hypothetical protein
MLTCTLNCTPIKTLDRPYLRPELQDSPGSTPRPAVGEFQAAAKTGVEDLAAFVIVLRVVVSEKRAEGKSKDGND